VAATLRLPGTEPGEERTAGLMLAHSLFMGLATVLFETAASALFLARFGSSALPYVYVAAAVLNVAIGAGYTSLSRRSSFPRLMAGTLWLLLGTTLALRAGLAFSHAAALTFLLLVWYRAISILTDLEYWAVAARIYDVRQAKRLFPVIGSGEVVARIAGSFAVPLLVARLGVENLLVLSAAALLACLVTVGAVLRGVAPDPPTSAPARPRSAGGLAGLVADRYLASLVGVAALAVLAKYLVDFAFLEQMRARYADARGLATTFAVFSGVTQALSLLTRVAVAGPLLRRYGVRVGLLVLPLAHIACTAVVIAAGWVPALDASVFWLVLANQGIYKTLKHPVDNPSFKVLYQPLAREQRLATQIAVETIVTPVTIGLAGGLMLLFTRAIHYDPTVFAWAMLAAFLAWAALASRAGREYGTALLDALRGRIVDDEPFVYGDPRSLAVLKGTLGSERAGDVLFALELLEKAGDPEVPAIRARLLGHAAAEVRRAAIAGIVAAKVKEHVPAVERLASGDPDPGARADAVRAVAALGSVGTRPVLEAALRDADPEVRRAALGGLLAAGSPVAEERLRAAAASDSAADRTLAARLVGEAPPDAARAVLLRALLADPRAEVRRAALQAAGRLRPRELWDDVAASLADPACRAAAAGALAAGGDEALPALDLLFAFDAPPAVLRQAARAAGRIRTPRATAALRARLDHRDPGVRAELLDALAAGGHREDEDRLDALVRHEAGGAARLAAALRDLEGTDGPVREALEGEIDGARRRVLRLLEMGGDAAAIDRVRDALSFGTKEKRAYALEALDVTLPSRLRAVVLPLVEDLAPADRAARLEEEFPQVALGRLERLSELARGEGTSAWTQACAARAAGIDTGDGGGMGMLTIEKVLCLKAAPMFAEASEEILADVAAILEEREARAGEVIIKKGDPGDSMYVIVRGQVRVFDGERTITRLGERDIFGELALLDPEPRVASVAAVTDTRLFRLDREGFTELMAGNIEIVRGVLHVLCERLRTQSAGGGYTGETAVTPAKQS
jgi:HEAT repeat protein